MLLASIPVAHERVCTVRLTPQANIAQPTAGVVASPTAVVLLVDDRRLALLIVAMETLRPSRMGVLTTWPWY